MTGYYQKLQKLVVDLVVSNLMGPMHLSLQLHPQSNTFRGLNILILLVHQVTLLLTWDLQRRV